MRPLWIKVFVTIACAAMIAGCGTTGALQNARTSLEKAKAAGAPEKAKVDYYTAEAYLEKADHEVSEGDNSQARYYASESEKYSGQAIRKAGGGAK